MTEGKTEKEKGMKRKGKWAKVARPQVGSAYWLDVGHSRVLQLRLTTKAVQSEGSLAM